MYTKMIFLAGAQGGMCLRLSKIEGELPPTTTTEDLSFNVFRRNMTQILNENKTQINSADINFTLLEIKIKEYETKWN